MCRLLPKYGQKKYKAVLDRLILTDRNKEREFPRWSSVLLILIETADSQGMVAVDRGLQMEEMRQAQVITDKLCQRL